MKQTDTERWDALVARDAASDGSFVYAVRTTGIFCRPSCPARRPKRENVAFHPTAEAARAAGYRPCRRCLPEGPPAAARHVEKIAALCRRLEESEEVPSLAALADEAGWSVYHLHRVFKAATGLTPKGFFEAHRARRVRDALQVRTSVTEAIYEAGFASSGRFYEASDRMLGMTPTRYRQGGSGQRIRFAVGACSLGSILVAATERGICRISLGDDPEALLRGLEQAFPQAELVGADAAFETLVARVVGVVDDPHVGADLPLDIRGTAFQQRVWNALLAIPPGSTATYAEIARAIGAPTSTRAVARACASNVLAVAIPCHRVVRTDGGLGGYRWGIERKAALLEREAAPTERGGRSSS